MRQVTGNPRPDVEPALVGVFNDFSQYATLAPEQRAQLRYVMVNHDNDGVTKFGADLVLSRPRWLDPDRLPTQEVSGASPRGVPPAMRWRPVTTFLHTLIDMKNAQAPGRTGPTRTTTGPTWRASSAPSTRYPPTTSS
jgi:uncharacterized membrane protein